MNHDVSVVLIFFLIRQLSWPNSSGARIRCIYSHRCVNGICLWTVYGIVLKKERKMFRLVLKYSLRLNWYDFIVDIYRIQGQSVFFFLLWRYLVWNCITGEVVFLVFPCVFVCMHLCVLFVCLFLFFICTMLIDFYFVRLLYFPQ